MLFRALLPDCPGVNPPETPEHGMKTDTHVSQVAFAGQRATLPSLPPLSSAFPQGSRFLSRSRLCSKRTVALGGWGVAHLPPQKCPEVPLSAVQRRFNEGKGMARDTASPTGLAGERGRCRGAREGDRRGGRARQQRGRRTQVGVCFPTRTHRGQGGTRAVMGPFTGSGLPRDKHPRT